MHLPLKYAASVPVGVAMLIGLAIGAAALVKGPIRVPTDVIAAGMPAFILASGTMLVLTLPNIAAAYAANRFSAGSLLAFCAIFIAVLLAAWLLQARLLSDLLGRGSPVPLDLGARVSLALGLNIVVCLAAAWWFGRKIIA